MKLLSIVIYGGFFLLFLGVQLALSYYFLPAFAAVGLALSLPTRILALGMPVIIATGFFILTVCSLASFRYEMPWLTWCQKKTCVLVVFIIGLLLTAFALFGLTAPRYTMVTPVY